jgi:hypothetical protein
MSDPDNPKIVDSRTHPWTPDRKAVAAADPGRFASKDSGEKVMWLSGDRAVLRDCMGNRQEIESIGGTDPQSRNQSVEIET